jgi:hypothetical protein
MAKLKFKVGDKVVITDNTSGHGFNIGDTVEICTTGFGTNYNARNAKASWYITAADCKLATNSKTPKTEQMATTNTTSTVKALVLGCAQSLMRANNTCTTLEIKLELRKTQPAYYWTQQIVSNIMDEFATAKVFTYSDNGTFRTYSDPSRPVTKVTKATKASKSTKTATKVAKSSSPAKKFTATGTISKTAALKLIRNNKGHFFTVVFTKKEDGSTRTMNCQYLSGQTVDKDYVKVREASLIRSNNPNPIRQFATSNMKMLSIAGTCYKVK